MTKSAVLFVDRDAKWLSDKVHVALGDDYEVCTARSLAEAKRLYPGRRFCLVFVTWVNTAAQRKEIADYNRHPENQDRIVVLLPQRPSNSEMRLIGRTGAFDFVDKPQTERGVRKTVSEEMAFKYPHSSQDIGLLNTNSECFQPA